MSTIGHDTEIIDEPIAPSEVRLTGRPNLLHTGGPATPVVTNRANTGNATVDGFLEVLLAGGAPEVVVQGYGAGKPTLAAAVALLPSAPGTVVAPEAITTADHSAIAAAWGAKKVPLLNGASGANDAALQALAAADIAATDMRGCGLWADWITYGKTVGTVAGPATLGVAAAIARNDGDRLGTGQAAGGKFGVLRGATAIVGGARSQASCDALAASQVNTCITYGSEIRNYGFRSLADLTTKPHWWGLQSARVIADYRARCAAINDETMWQNIDSRGKTLGGAVALRQAIIADMLAEGALYGDIPAEAGSVQVVSTTAQHQSGQVVLRSRLKVSPFVEHVLDSISSRPITAAA